ncbi:MAG: bifunctional polysaccharide deacetylase/glycosyltransferase family 2 protein, partial [Cytophagaceae bacterium]
PDEKYTPQVLDILKRENIKAAFFITGIKAENNIPLLNRIHKEGHEIGNHSFTHPNFMEVSRKRAEIELRVTKRLIECITGHSTRLYRPPYSADKYMESPEEVIPVSFGKDQHYYRIGDPVNPKDWQDKLPSDSIIERVKREHHLGRIVLLHDGGGNRQATIEALPEIIRFYRKNGYRFATISELLDKPKDELMPPLNKDTDLYLSYGNLFLAHTVFYGQRVLVAIFFTGLLLGIARFLLMLTLAVKQKRREKRTKRPIFEGTPKVSIIVPAYNEEVTAIKTIETLLKSDYPDFDIIFVDDGSTDQTYQKAMDAYGEHPKCRIVTKPNGGKATALNYGIAMSDAEYLVCIDADTQLKPDAVRRLMESFYNENVGAVAGNVKVGNEKSLITIWQSIEYITGQNFDRRAFDLLNCITIVPGAIGAFRKAAMLNAGMFTTDTLAEDCDLSMRILRKGYKICYNNDAIAYTEVPETTGMFLKQRFRWTFGVLQSFWKHRDTMLEPKYKYLGMVAMPNIFIFQVLIPLFAPLADIIMMMALLTGNASNVLAYYLAFLFIEAGGAILAFSFEKEKLGRLLLLLPQRLIYRHLMWYALFKSLIRALKGELMSWGVLKRTGSVNINTET